MSDNLPNYKQVFIEEMEMLRRKEQEEQEDLHRQSIRDTMQQEAPKPGATHESWNQSQYSDSKWRTNINSTFYRQEHNDTQFHLNNMLNPEVAKKKHNVRVTQISEYSNAKHNNTVFLNPKHSSC